ncbi:PadR family transcriptional regulator [Arthrobacter sp. FX8]|uniref:PadR family transcriptional regulator n=1 Tax=Arthrobacter sp. FX8 TaxID=2997335 RepID=UPI00227C2DDA|nr:PadR family transcriptional regulator [Arthrobacter sp. FX8]WAJ32948.1 PadR family transcriptional regulator [Arthrobacter sp. FX8]
MKLEFPLLGLLAARRMSGYDIRRWVDVEGKFVGLDRHPSQIYRELNRMEADGLVTHEIDARDNAPDAKVYQLTDDGFSRLTKWIRAAYVPPARFQDPAFLLRLRMTVMLDPALARLLVEEEHAARLRQVAENRGRERALDHLVDGPARPEINTKDLALVADFMNEYGEDAIDAWINWLERLMGRLDGIIADQSETVTTHTDHGKA